MTSPALAYDATRHCLCSGGDPVLTLAPGWSAVGDPTGAGCFLHLTPDSAVPWLTQPLGQLNGLRRFTSLQRFSPYWLQPAVGTREADVRPETLWLLAAGDDGGYTMLVPLLSGASRHALRGSPEGLAVTAETGDAGIAVQPGVALYVASGRDPYQLATQGARAVQVHLGLGRLRADKPLPDFIDLFGWCTWDAFYKDVSGDRLLAGLDSLTRAGFPPPLVILDDGWQQWQRTEGGEDRLMSLLPNARFGGDLSTVITAARQQHGVRRFLVWHALLGYWGGLDEQAFLRYGTRTVPRGFGPGLLEQEPRLNVWPWGTRQGVPAAEGFAQFYDDWHAMLAAQGVDGVKVDVQATLESVSQGQGGRVELARVVRQALEDSVQRHFQGRLINCMSSTQECAYQSSLSTLMRSSDDFFPRRPETHGRHIHTNALVGLWFGEFMQPDWDMFHSAHPRGAFHGAARAISGGPVYVSDEVGAHDPAVLGKLVLSDGTVLRADLPGRPTPDTLLADPTTEAVLLKVFNANRDCGVVGVFNAALDAPPIEGRVTPADLPVLDPARRYAAFAHQQDRVWCCDEQEPAQVALPAGGWEIVSFAPIEHEFAALGLADKFNSTGAITRRDWHAGNLTLALRDGGRFVAWARRAPAQVSRDGAPLPFTWNAHSGRLDADIPAGAACRLELAWQ